MKQLEDVIIRGEQKLTPSTAKILVEALPYIQQLSGSTIVIKLGGNAMIDEKLKQNFARDVILLKQVGMHPVVIHGGGPQITDYLTKVGIKSDFADGMRITDPESIHVIEMVLGGLVNKDLVKTITALGGKAVGLSGKDGGLIRAKKVIGKGEFKNIDFKNTGTVQSIDPEVVRLLDGSSFIPVIAPIGIGDDGKTYNINADIVAGKIAHILQASKYLILTDTQGILDANDKLIQSINAEGVRSLISRGVISKGMLPKVNSALEAVSSGVEHVQIINGTFDHSVLLELFTDEGIGTMIRRK
mgnify:FL=1|tara:strand:+ start:418 stop:1320 length:903 start_codon:yes stop_codon:yes gene_type:complete